MNLQSAQQAHRPSLRMPAEWEPQLATWFSWPHNQETWPHNLTDAQSEFIQLIRLVAESQPVFILAGPPDEQLSFIEYSTQIANQIGTTQNIELVNIPTNDAWARDYAPTFVKNEVDELVAVDWRYNAWGGKYPPYDLDQKVSQLIARYLGIQSISPPLCFEGGAIEVNSNGILLTTRTCCFDENRNAGLTVPVAEKILAEHLGTREIIWLTGDAIDGDDTDGHIDQLARFVDDQTVVRASCKYPTPAQARLDQNAQDLRKAAQGKGLVLTELELPIPAPFMLFGRQIPASYCNFLITNELVVVPQFNQPEDEFAIELLSSVFQTRDVVGVSSIQLSVGLGSFHCLSQQQPV